MLTEEKGIDGSREETSHAASVAGLTDTHKRFARLISEGDFIRVYQDDV